MHESFAFFEIEMLKPHPIIWFVDCTFNSNPERVPPTLDCNKMHVGLFQKNGIVYTHGTMPYVGLATLEQLIVLCVFLVTNSNEISKCILPSHIEGGSPKRINNSNNIPICLSIICHEPLEVGVGEVMLEHNFV